MEKAQRLELAKTFLARMTETILLDIEKMPDEFDGFEVKAYCRVAFDREGDHKARQYSAWNRKRSMDFNNWRRVTSTRY